MGSIKFPKLFLGSGRVGYYFRVLDEGVIHVDDRIERERADAGQVTIQALVQLVFGGQKNPALLERALKNPALSPEWRHLLKRTVDGRVSESERSAP